LGGGQAAVADVEGGAYLEVAGDQFVESHDDLSELAAILDELAGFDHTEDVVVWQGFRVVAVRLADGKLTFPNGVPAEEGGDPCF